MLKISTMMESLNQYRLALEGKLIAPWATELRTECAKTKQQLKGRVLIVDMRNLVAISQEGEDVLLELMNEGAKFCGCGVFTKHVLKLLARRSHEDVQEETDDVRWKEAGPQTGR